MRPPKALTSICISLLLFQNVGCVSFKPLRSDLPVGKRDAQSGTVVRVTTRDGERRKLVNVFADSLSLRGQTSGRFFWQDPQEVAIPKAEVTNIEERRFSATKTVILVGSIVGVLVWGMAEAMSDWKPLGEGSIF